MTSRETDIFKLNFWMHSSILAYSLYEMLVFRTRLGTKCSTVSNCQYV